MNPPDKPDMSAIDMSANEDFRRQLVEKLGHPIPDNECQIEICVGEDGAITKARVIPEDYVVLNINELPETAEEFAAFSKKHFGTVYPADQEGNLLDRDKGEKCRKFFCEKMQEEYKAQQEWSKS